LRRKKKKVRADRGERKRGIIHGKTRGGGTSVKFTTRAETGGFNSKKRGKKNESSRDSSFPNRARKTYLVGGWLRNTCKTRKLWGKDSVEGASKGKAGRIRKKELEFCQTPKGGGRGPQTANRKAIVPGGTNEIRGLREETSKENGPSGEVGQRKKKMVFLVVSTRPDGGVWVREGDQHASK